MSLGHLDTAAHGKPFTGARHHVPKQHCGSIMAHIASAATLLALRKGADHLVCALQPHVHIVMTYASSLHLPTWQSLLSGHHYIPHDPEL